MNEPPDLPPRWPAPGSPPSNPQPQDPRTIVGYEPVTKPASPWKKIFGPIAGVGVLLLKFFGQFKLLLLPLLKFFPLILKTGGTMILSVGVYAMAYGWKWAVGFVLLLFVHECGHLIVARQFGLKVSAPVFIPFMGAFILLKEAPRDAWMEACVGIGGPICGSIGGLFCHALGLYFESPLLVSLGYSAYFLNLFNLTPVGQLDGGRIATALSPWLWLPGLAIMIWFGLQHMNPIIILILIMSVPRVISLFRHRTEAEQRYFEVTPVRRARVAAMYFGLIALLLLGMHSTHEELRDFRDSRNQPSFAATPSMPQSHM